MRMIQAAVVVCAVALSATAGDVAGGCSTCGAGGAGGAVAARHGGLFGPRVGTASPVGCGCFASEKTFLWGGCKQFFGPGRDCFGNAIQYGPGGMSSGSFCTPGGSYLNR